MSILRVIILFLGKFMNFFEEYFFAQFSFEASLKKRQLSLRFLFLFFLDFENAPNMLQAFLRALLHLLFSTTLVFVVNPVHLYNCTPYWLFRSYFYVNYLDFQIINHLIALIIHQFSSLTPFFLNFPL